MADNIIQRHLVVYTTHIEMPQVPPNFHEDMLDTLYFWETMIQNTQNGQWLGFQARYKTQKDAEDGHWIAYDKLEDMMLYPDKYPQDTISRFVNSIHAAQEPQKTMDGKVKKNLT